MDYLRDLGDFIDDLPDYDPFDPIVLKLPDLEEKLTLLIRKLRSQIDIFKTAQRTLATRTVLSRGNDTYSSLQQQQQQQQQPQSWRTPGLSSLCAKQSSSPPAWAVARSYSRAAVANVPRPIHLPTEEKVKDIAVSKNMVIRSIEINDLSAIRRDGVVYYIPRVRRFAIRLAGGIILHGNIGTVYSSESCPVHIRDCELYPECRRQGSCTFYHNPLTCEGSVDIRNFFDTSWLYRPGSRVVEVKKIRKLASRDNLDMDIQTITTRDLAYYNEQIMHDLLCCIIMNYYARRDYS